MRRLETVLGDRRTELVQVLVRCDGLTRIHAERFVALAGDELLESYAWHCDGHAPRHLAEPAMVRDVLSTMGANRIASSLGISRSEVWDSLRAFVPRVLCLADCSEAA